MTETMIRVNLQQQLRFFNIHYDVDSVTENSEAILKYSGSEYPGEISIDNLKIAKYVIDLKNSIDDNNDKKLLLPPVLFCQFIFDCIKNKWMSDNIIAII